jgi:hypothetical protein
MMDFTRLNINAGGFSVPGYRGDQALFQRIEDILAASLPAEYVALLKFADGGHPELSSINPIDPAWDYGLHSIDWIYSMQNSEIPQLLKIYEVWASILGSKCLPFANDGANNQFYLDLNFNPAKVFFYTTSYGPAKRYIFANSFADFINSLQLDPDFI